MILIRNIKKKNANRFIINQLAFYVVDCYDILSNLFDDIRTINHVSRELQERHKSALILLLT